MALAIDRQALRRGVATYVGIAAPCGLVIALAGSNTAGAAGTSGTSGNESPLWILAAVLIFVVAPLVAGGVAGAAQTSPFLHGALAVAVPAVAFLVVRTVVGLVQHSMTAADVVSFLLYLVIVTGLGMLGGYVGFRRRRNLA